MNACRFDSSAQTVGDYRAQLGETPVWCNLSHSLLWVDILDSKLLRYWPNKQRGTEIRRMPRFTSAVLLSSEPELFVVVSQCGINLYHYPSATFTPLCEWPEKTVVARPNEAAIAPDGALWFSSMDPDAKQRIGGWYRLESGQTAPQKLLSHQGIPNTLHWWKELIWFADSSEHCFYAAVLSEGTLRVTHHLPVEGVPDGSALTRDGLLINARWGDARLSCFSLDDPLFQEQVSLCLPVHQPTCCTFGGETLSDLYITSALTGLVAPKTTDGALLKITTTLTGKPACRFRL